MKCLLLQISAKKMYCDFKKGINLQFMFQWKVKPLQHFGKLVHYDTTNAKDKNEPLQESIIFACSQCPCPRDVLLYNTLLLPVCTCLELRMKKLYERNEEHTQCGSLNNLWIFADTRLVLALRTSKGTTCCQWKWYTFPNLTVETNRILDNLEISHSVATFCVVPFLILQFWWSYLILLH